MASISIPIPNLISGVSQQPETLRTSTAAEAVENAWLSVVSGNSKRPPLEHIAKLSFGVDASAVGYVIDRDDTYQYIVVVTKNDLKVYDFFGVEQTVLFPDGKSYLAQSVKPVQDFKFLTFSDTTFILNRQVSVVEDNFGERGTANYIPTGTLTNVSQLPANPNQGDTYFITTEGTYYQFVHVDATYSTVAWAYQGTIDSPLAYPVVSTLPTPNTLGQTCVIFNGSNYDLYKVIATGDMTPARNEWQNRRLSDLVPQIDNGRFNPLKRASFLVINSVANVNYSIYIGGALKANFTTANGMDANNALQSTSAIAGGLCNGLIASGYDAFVAGSTICVNMLDPTVGIAVTSTNGDKVLRCYRDSVAQFSDLPPNEVVGRIVKVKGAAKDNQDDYYVRWDGQLWDETFGYNQGTGLLSSSMPHTLRRNENGTWTFGEHEWDERKTGDANSNPGPSFIGHTLNDIIVYTGRMAILSDTNIVLSKTGEFEGYYRTNMQTLVDDDPIDLEVLSPNVDRMQHAIQFNRDMLLFSDRAEFRFSYTQYVGPKNVQVQYTTSFPCSRYVKPVNLGSSVYFVDDQPTYHYAKVFEYFPKDNLAGDDADNVTDPVPRYLPKGIRFITASPRVKCMIAGNDTEPNALFVYKFYWNADKKVQNSWSKWVLPGVVRVHWAGFSNNYLYALIERSDGIYLEKVRVDEEVFDEVTGTRVLLDRQCQAVAKAYASASDTTIFTLPYTIPDDIQAVSDGSMGSDLWHMPSKIGASSVSIPGNLSADTVAFGISYTFRYTFSTPYVRFPRSNGQGELVTIDGRLQMRYMSLEYHNTSYFETLLEYTGRDPVGQVFDAKVADETGVAFNATPVASGTFRIPLMGQNIRTKLTITNNSPFASAFGGAEWYANYTPKAKRIS